LHQLDDHRGKLRRLLAPGAGSLLPPRILPMPIGCHHRPDGRKEVFDYSIDKARRIQEAERATADVRESEKSQRANDAQQKKMDARRRSTHCLEDHLEHGDSDSDCE
jgi:hypothetical protein